MKSYTG